LAVTIIGHNALNCKNGRSVFYGLICYNKYT